MIVLEVYAPRVLCGAIVYTLLAFAVGMWLDMNRYDYRVRGEPLQQIALLAALWGIWLPLMLVFRLHRWVPRLVRALVRPIAPVAREIGYLIDPVRK